MLCASDQTEPELETIKREVEVDAVLRMRDRIYVVVDPGREGLRLARQLSEACLGAGYDPAEACLHA